ncbi:MAG: TolC family protein [Chitinophagaceae bacterium]
MQKRSFLYSFLFFLLPAGIYAQPAAGHTYSLKQCIETGIQNSLAVQQSGLQMQASDINRKQSQLDRLPDLNGSVNHGINHGRSIDPFTNSYINEQVNFANYSLSSGVILFNGLSINHTVKQTTLAYEASKMDWQQTKDNLTINIILAYLQALSNEDLLVQAQHQAELTQKQVQRLEVLNADGAIRPSDLSDLKGQLAGDQLAVVNTRNTVATAMLNLCELMNILYDPNMKLERLDPVAFAAVYETTPAQVYQTALSQFALIRSVTLRTRSAEYAVKARRGQLFPTLSLNGSANSNYSSAAMQSVFVNTTTFTTSDYVVISGTPVPVISQQNNYTSEKIGYTRQLNNNIFTSVSLNLSIPLFNSFRARNRIRLAQIDAKNYALIEHTAKTQLQQNIERAYVNMTIAFDRYRILLDQVQSFTESLRAAEIRFNEGVDNSVDYLLARTNLDRAANNLIMAKYDYALKTKVLDYYQGRAGW